MSRVKVFKYFGYIMVIYLYLSAESKNNHHSQWRLSRRQTLVKWKVKFKHAIIHVFIFNIWTNWFLTLPYLKFEQVHLTPSARQAKTYICANSVDPDEMAQNNQSHLMIWIYTVCILFLILHWKTYLRQWTCPNSKMEVHFRNLGMKDLTTCTSYV